MHRVVAGLSEINRSALLGHPLYVALPEDRKTQLLDEVLRIRKSLAYDDHVAEFRDQGKRMADVATLKNALNAALTVLGRPNLIAVDMIDGMTDFHRGMEDLRAFEAFSRHMLEVIERLSPEPQDDRQQRTRRQKGEASRLCWMFEDFGMKVSRNARAARKSSSGLALLGLLATRRPLARPCGRVCGIKGVEFLSGGRKFRPISRLVRVPTSPKIENER